MIQDTTQLTRAEKASLTGGIDLWHTVAVERLGVPSLRLTDGPNGARGEKWSSGTSACLPCGSALAATWNRDLIRRVGRVLAEEARAKGAQVLLAPTVNIHRHPLGGRHFESFSEDPYLSAQMAVAYITGVQERGVSAVVKHFVCNDQEYERESISVDVDERTLREIYLPPFEAAVRVAGVWAAMSAYNRLGGTYCSEHRALLTSLLRDELGFDGLVMSDWGGTHGAAAVEAGLDLEMPGPPKFLGRHLEDSLAQGVVSEAALDRAAAALLKLIERTAGIPDGAVRVGSASDVAREAASEAIVLLRNEGLLPLDAAALRRLAVIGPLARRPAAQGGGSAEVTPPYIISPLDALRARLGDTTHIVYEPGCSLPGLLPALDAQVLTQRDDGQGVLEVTYFSNPDFVGEPVGREVFPRTRIMWQGAPLPGVPAGTFSARGSATFVPDRSGRWRFGLASAGQARLLLNGTLIVDNFNPTPGETFFGRGSEHVTGEVDVEAGTAYALLVEFRAVELSTAGLQVGAEPILPADAVQRAASAAADADVALVIVGYDGRWESESFDRPHMDLPGTQDALIRAVLEANPRTVVAVNAGSPVTMDWSDDVPAVLQLWFPGQECGTALADVLFGDVDASGRLPTTFPRRLEDTPAHANYPGSHGTVQYAERLFVGYRHYDRRQIEPRWAFGHGLSYTTFGYGALHADIRGASVELAIDVTNTGSRLGSEVVQVYVHDVEASVDQPDRQLAEFSKVRLAPAETQTVRFTLPRRAFAYWDVASHDWKVEPGAFEVLVGSSSRAIRARALVHLE